MTSFRSLTVALGFAVLRASAQASAATPPQKLTLSIDTIMRGQGLVGWEPQAVRWSGDSTRIFFQWKRHTDPINAPFDTYTIHRDGSGLRKLSEDEAKTAPPPPGFGGRSSGGHRSPDKSKIVYTDSGDIYVHHLKDGTRQRITRTGDAEMGARFLNDSKRISFVRGNNLYVVALDSPLIEQLTDIRPAGSPPAEPRKGTESQEFLKKEERELIEAIRERVRRREEFEARQKRENPRKPYILQGRQQVASLQISGDEKTVLALINEPATDSKTAIVPNFVTESAYTEDLQTRNKAGDVQSRVRPALINVQTGEWKWVEFEEDKKERPVQMSSLAAWNEDGSRLAMIAESTDNKHRWIVTVDLATAKARSLAHDEDKAWIGGPGMNTLGWLASGKDLYFQSERTGWSHLYTVPTEAGEPKALTSGNWEVNAVRLSEDKSTFYLTTSEGSPHEQHIYAMAVTGGPRRKLTSAPGSHELTLSPDEKWIADVHSYTNRPPELYVQENREGAGVAARKLTDSPAPEFATYAWLDVPIVYFTARDGAKIPARLYKPANFKKGGPAVVFVHGAGYLQNVHRWWSNYFREYMFHHLLMEKGYAVLDVDYRASAGYGRDWRTGIYRYMGGKDLDDQVDGVQWLIATHGVDPRKIGIYGGSYGGFITLMAMFTHPGVFAAGAALRPVTDWAHYNHPYTSNILNTPQKDTEAYKRSSPIYHAAGLKGALLICHGMVDINVHYQDSVRLAQRLIELRKENWELASYPVEDHGFVQPTSWADEYKRILKLFETNLR